MKTFSFTDDEVELICGALEAGLEEIDDVVQEDPEDMESKKAQDTINKLLERLSK